MFLFQLQSFPPTSSPVFASLAQSVLPLDLIGSSFIDNESSLCADRAASLIGLDDLRVKPKVRLCLKGVAAVSSSRGRLNSILSSSR